MSQDLPSPEDLLKESVALERTASRRALQLVTFSCPQCGVFFKPTRKWQRFCSDRCRKLAFKLSKTVLQPED